MGVSLSQVLSAGVFYLVDIVFLNYKIGLVVIT